MAVPGWLTLDIYVMLLAWMLLLFGIRRKQKMRQDRTFLTLLVTVIILLTADMMSRCDPEGLPGRQYILSRIGNYLIFAGDPFGYLMALLYIDSWISEPEKKRSGRFVKAIVCFYVLLNFLLVTVSEIGGFGWFYCFPERVYQRGPLFVPRGIMNMLFCLLIGMYILFRRREIRTEYTNYVIAFPLIVLFSGMLQVFVGGAAYEYAGTVFACLLMYIYVQNHNIDVDYLTGLLNRRGIDEELKYRIRHADSERAFCTYLLDLDFFKTINDVCGHESGDEALRTMAVLQRKAFGRDAVIGRYGGDEFLIINNAESHAEAEACIHKMEELCRKFNDEGRGHGHYRLGFSAGFAVYDAQKYPTEEAYFCELDARMYAEKNRHHAVR